MRHLSLKTALLLALTKQRLHMLCPLSVLHAYLDRTKDFRKSDQLFISWAGLSLSNSSHTGLWRQLLLGIRVWGSRHQRACRLTSAVIWALFRGVTIQDIYIAVSWSSPLAFVRFNGLDISTPSVAQAVLGTGSSLGYWLLL